MVMMIKKRNAIGVKSNSYTSCVALAGSLFVNLLMISWMYACPHSIETMQCGLRGYEAKVLKMHTPTMLIMRDSQQHLLDSSNILKTNRDKFQFSMTTVKLLSIGKPQLDNNVKIRNGSSKKQPTPDQLQLNQKSRRANRKNLREALLTRQPLVKPTVLPTTEIMMMTQMTPTQRR